jgi:predicted transcriptional regulator of viral defense system
MAIKDYLNTHQVFNMRDFRDAFPESVTDLNLLARAIKKGKVDRVRSGLFVSRSERFFDAEPSPFAIATKAVDDALFCYMSALQLHGLLHNVINSTQFFTNHRLPRFNYRNHTFIPVLLTGRTSESLRVMSQKSSSFLVTTKEQTVVDCLFHLGLAGGPENLLRSLAAVRYLDVNATIKLAGKTNKSTCARLGWVLEIRREDWGVSEDNLAVLSARIDPGPHYFCATASSKNGYHSNRWKLYLPFPEQEMIAWLNP